MPLLDHRLNGFAQNDDMNHTTYLDVIASYQQDMSAIEEEILHHNYALSTRERCPRRRNRDAWIRDHRAELSVKDRYRNHVDDQEQIQASILVEATGCTLPECISALRLHGNCLDTAFAHLIPETSHPVPVSRLQEDRRRTEEWFQSAEEARLQMEAESFPIVEHEEPRQIEGRDLEARERRQRGAENAMRAEPEDRSDAWIRDHRAELSVKDRYRNHVDDQEQIQASILVEATGCTLPECISALRLHGNCLHTAFAHLIPETSQPVPVSRLQEDRRRTEEWFQSAEVARLQMEAESFPTVEHEEPRQIEGRDLEARERRQRGAENAMQAEPEDRRRVEDELARRESEATGHLIESVDERNQQEQQVRQGVEEDGHTLPSQRASINQNARLASGHDEAPTGAALVLEERNGCMVGELGVPTGIAALGLSLESYPPQCPHICGVNQGSWAEKMGVKTGFTIIAINGEDVSNLSKEMFCEQMKMRPLTLRFEDRGDFEEDDGDDAGEQDEGEKEEAVEREGSTEQGEGEDDEDSEDDDEDVGEDGESWEESDEEQSEGDGEEAVDREGGTEQGEGEENEDTEDEEEDVGEDGESWEESDEEQSEDDEEEAVDREGGTEQGEGEEDEDTEDEEDFGEDGASCEESDEEEYHEGGSDGLN